MSNRASDYSATKEPCQQQRSVDDYTKYRHECCRLVEEMLHAVHLGRPIKIAMTAREMIDASLRHESDSVARLAIQIEAAAMRNDLAEVTRLLPELGALVDDI